jgi:hypothetical protein
MITANSAWSTRRRRSSSDGKNEPVRSFGIRSSRSPGGRGQGPGAVTLAQVGAFRVTLVRGGADQLGELGLDQRLVDGLGRGADPVATSATLNASRTSRITRSYRAP